MRGSRVLVKVVAALAVLGAAATSPAVASVQSRLPTVASTTGEAVAAAADPVWSAPVTAVPDRGKPSDVSCPTATWCMAVDLSGRVSTFNGTSWSTPKAVFARVDGQNPGVRAVSCPTTTFCLAVSDFGYGVYRSGTWATVRSALAPLHEVDCYNAYKCAVVAGELGSEDRIGYWDGDMLTGFVDAPWAQGVDAVSCPTAWNCFGLGVAADESVIGLRAVGRGWAATYVGAGHHWADYDLSCAGAQFCMATSYESTAWTWNGARWRSAGATWADLGLNPVSVSCTSATSCHAVGEMRVGRWNGSTWTVHQLTYSYGGGLVVDCATSSACVVVDDRGRYYRGARTTWTTAATFDATSGQVADLSCPTSTFCMATDYYGTAARWTGGTWATPTRLGSLGSAVSCTSATWCMTVDAQQGTSRVWSGTWRSAVVFDNINVHWPSACASSTACFTFQGGDVRRWNGSTWGRSSTLFSTSEDVLLSCRSGFCMVMAADGLFRTWNGSSWSAARRSGLTQTSTLSCVSRTSCIVIALDNTYSTFDGSSWSVRRSLPESMSSMACQTSTRCLATTSDGVVYAWNGVSWAQSPNRLSFQAIRMACVPTRCMAVGQELSSWTL